MKKLFLILTLIGIMINAYSQTTLLWSRDFTTGLANYYSEYPVLLTDADTIKVIGRKNTNNGQRLLIIKYNLNGDTISTKTFGNDSVFNNTLIDYKFDSTNHVYLLHKEQLGFYKSKIVLQKYSLDGNLIWVEQIQNLADTSYTPHSLGLANDTCLFITAYKEYDYPALGDDVIFTTSLPYLYTYNSNGSNLWKREFNRSSEIYWFSYGIFVHNNTAFLFGNNNLSFNNLLKVDIYNNILVNNNTGILNGIGNVQLTPDNNLLITAEFGKYRISKANLNGTVIWTYDYGTNLPSNVSGDEIKSTIQDSTGNIYITGRHYGQNYGTPSYTNADILTIKYNSNGNLIWQNRYEYGVNNADIGNTIALKNSQIYVGGNSQRLGQGGDYDYVILKIDSISGVSTGVYRYDGIASGDDAVSSLAVFDNGNVALTGLSYINSQYDWTTQLLSDVVLSIPSFETKANLEIFPNPIKRGTSLTLEGNDYRNFSIYSLIGQVVQSGNLTNVNNKIVLPDDIKAGIYFLHLSNDNSITTRKIIVK